MSSQTNYPDSSKRARCGIAPFLTFKKQQRASLCDVDLTAVALGQHHSMSNYRTKSKQVKIMPVSMLPTFKCGAKCMVEENCVRPVTPSRECNF